jgi:hypothetical protein
MAQERGSDKLVEQWLGKGMTLPEGEIRKLYDIFRAEGVSIKRWWIYGIPGPDEVGGVVHVQPQHAGKVLTELAALRDIMVRFEVFPLGIINPEGLEVSFRTEGTRLG